MIVSTTIKISLKSRGFCEISRGQEIALMAIAYWKGGTVLTHSQDKAPCIVNDMNGSR